MTDVDELQAGIVLDTFIAEKLMGLHMVKEPGWDSDGPEHPVWRNAHGMKVSEHMPPRYSSDIAQAWLVAERIYKADDAFSWQVEICDEGTAFVTLTFGLTTDIIYYSGDDPIPFPLAVCRAGIRAWEVKPW